MEEEFIIALVAVVSIFIVFPGMVFHYITQWRKQKTLLPDDERMLEDLWRSAKAMERRIETMEQLLETVEDDEPAPARRRPRSTDRFEDQTMPKRHEERPFRDSIKRDRHEDEMFRSPNPKQLYRSRTDKCWLGVCGGIAERFGWEPVLVRILAVVSFFVFAGPLIILAYIILAMITPKAPIGGVKMAPEEDQFWRNVSDRPRTTASGLKYTFMDLEDRLRNLERNVTSEEWRLKKAFRDLEQN